MIKKLSSFVNDIKSDIKLDGVTDYKQVERASVKYFGNSLPYEKIWKVINNLYKTSPAIAGDTVSQDELPIRNNKIDIQNALKAFGVGSIWHMTHYKNINTILKNGLLNHTDAHKLLIEDISEPSVQSHRNRMEPIYNRPINSYVPFYIKIKNPMLYVRKEIQQEICILEIDIEALNNSEFVFTDGNAASKDTIFYAYIGKLVKLPWNVLNDDFWSEHEDGKRKRCAEILVHTKVDPKYIKQIHCYDFESITPSDNPDFNFIINKELYF